MASGKVGNPRGRGTGACLEPLDARVYGQTKAGAASAFGPEFDRLFDDTARRRLVSCVRDRAYLRWRYLDCPKKRQQPFAIMNGSSTLGFVAIEEHNKRAVVADLFTSGDPRLMETAVQVTINHLTRAGCTRIEMGVTDQSALDVAVAALVVLQAWPGPLPASDRAG